MAFALQKCHNLAQYPQNFVGLKAEHTLEIMPSILFIYNWLRIFFRKFIITKLKVLQLRLFSNHDYLV